MRDLSALRRDYDLGELREADVAGSWWEQFGRWFGEARRLREPHAMVLATADADGRPSVRTVLLKSYDAAGFVWATNYRSRKGRDLSVNPRAALCFSWLDLERQVNVEGVVTPTSAAESDAIFASRPRGAQLAAWASAQSDVLPGGRAALEAARDEVAARHGDGPVPRPRHWGGYRLAPDVVEFWQGRRDRLHDRLRYRCSGSGWVLERLYP